MDAKISRFDFKGEWYDAFGMPQSTGIWFIYGESGSGKTTFVLKLIKCLSQYGSVLFESHEEGEMSASLQDGIKRVGLLDARNVRVVDETIEEMVKRLESGKSSKVIVIDSTEHSGIKDIGQVIELKRRFPRKLFVFVGQASGSKPRTMLGESILFVANQKIWIEGYRAFSRGRSMGPVRYYTIWDEEARIYWNK